MMGAEFTPGARPPLGSGLPGVSAGAGASGFGKVGDPVTVGACQGDHFHAGCLEALAHIDEFVDDEVAPGDREAIAAHLRDCPPCMKQFAVEQLLKALVARSCADQAPPALRARVVAQLMTVRIQLP